MDDGHEVLFGEVAQDAGVWALWAVAKQLVLMLQLHNLLLEIPFALLQLLIMLCQRLIPNGQLLQAILELGYPLLQRLLIHDTSTHNLSESRVALRLTLMVVLVGEDAWAFGAGELLALHFEVAQAGCVRGRKVLFEGGGGGG